MSDILDILNYETDGGDGSITVKGVKDKSVSELILPEGVREVSFMAFSGCNSLKSITLPKSLIYFNTAALYSCEKLESITVAEGNPFFRSIDGNLYSVFGQSLSLIRYAIGKRDAVFELPRKAEGIESLAFTGGTNLKKLVLHSGVNKIKDRALLCPSLEEVQTDEENQSFKVQDKALLTKDGRLLVCYIGASGKVDFTVPEGVEQICDYAFMRNTSITRVTLPSGLRTIGTGAFRECSSLESIRIPDTLCELGSEAFYCCESLKEIKLPEGVGDIKRITFLGCESLTSLSLPEGLSEIGEFAFRQCKRLSSVSLPGSVRTIGERAFGECPVKEVTYGEDSALWATVDVAEGNEPLLNSTFHYMKEALEKDYSSSNIDLDEVLRDFEYTRSGDELIEITGVKDQQITEVTIPYGVTSIGDGAFELCSSLVKITIPDTVRVIGKEAFNNCRLLRELTLPEGLLEIGDCAFGNCKTLTRVSLPASLTKVGVAPFWACESIAEITVAADNTAYRSQNGDLYTADSEVLIQYASGKNESRVTIPEGVKTVGERAFEMAKLERLVLPDSLQALGVCAFCNCFRLTEAELGRSLRTVGESAFGYCTGLKKITVPGEIAAVDSNVFYNTKELTDIEIYESSTTLGVGITWACDTLTTLILPSGLERITTSGVMSGGNRTGVANVRFRGDKKQWKSVLKHSDKGAIKLLKKSKVEFV